MIKKTAGHQDAKWWVKWRKLIAGFLLSPPVGFVALFLWNMNGKMAAQEERINSHTKEITDLKAATDKQDTKISEIHWYLIKRNNVEVPADLVKRNAE